MESLNWWVTLNQRLAYQNWKGWKVLVRQYRKVGRKYVFGLVHFLTRSHAEVTMPRLNGTKVSIALLSVTKVRFVNFKRLLTSFIIFLMITILRAYVEL